VQAFSNPGGGTLTLPADYNFYYGDGKGGVAYTNDATYQPPVGFQRLQRTPN
jgi:hypothetical protein